MLGADGWSKTKKKKKKYWLADGFPLLLPACCLATCLSCISIREGAASVLSAAAYSGEPEAAAVEGFVEEMMGAGL